MNKLSLLSQRHGLAKRGSIVLNAMASSYFLLPLEGNRRFSSFQVEIKFLELVEGFS